MLNLDEAVPSKVPSVTAGHETSVVVAAVVPI